MIVPIYNNNVIYHCYVEVAMQENTPDTLNKIQKAALKEFLDKGFLGASLRQIVKDAGVTTGAFYGYFSSKEALFASIVEPHAAALMGRFMEAQWNCQESCSLKNTQNSLSIIVQFADCNRCNCSSHIFGILSSSP